MPDSSPFSSKPSPQFATVEYATKPGGDICATCKTPITGRYYRINGALNCETCTEISRRQIPSDSHTAFVRALLFGIGGAILGLIIYSTFGIVTGLVIGYLSLAVGYIVGKAMNLGARGLGGRRYQIAAVVLTYAAVSLSAIPIAISQYRKQPAASHVQVAPSDASSSAQNPGDTPIAGADNAKAPPRVHNFAAAIGYLALLGLASPFLELQDPIHGVLGLIILSVGIRIAWRLTAGSDLQVFGPFENNASAPASKA
jgi:hypothetical protein